MGKVRSHVPAQVDQFLKTHIRTEEGATSATGWKGGEKLRVRWPELSACTKNTRRKEEGPPTKEKEHPHERGRADGGKNYSRGEKETL